MHRPTVTRLAASSLILASVAATVPATGANPTAQAAKEAADARRALARAKPDAAVLRAEQAVMLSPQDASHRLLLGQAYLAAGRFQSAEASLADVLTLDPANAAAAFNLTLTQIALAKPEAALATLTPFKDRVPVADYALAVALIGDVGQAVALLEPAVRGPDADAKTRQNLALAYALAGKWIEAKAMAAQDLSPREVWPRLAEWARFAQPRASWDQVATLLKVRPAVDAGMPQQLALAPAPTEVAAAAPTPAPEPEPAREEVAAIAEEPTPAPVATVDPSYMVVPAAMTVAEAPLIAAPAAPYRFTPENVRPRLTVRRHAPPPARVVAPAVPKRVATGGFVVQLGAFAQSGNVEAAWQKLDGRVRLADYTPSRSTFMRAGATLHRLSITGFATRGAATALCTRIKTAGGDCFVREAAGEAPMQWVRRGEKKGVALASR